MSTMQLVVSRDYDQPAEALWPIIADLSGYADHVGGLRSTVASANEAGATRVCTNLKGQDWSETVTEWNDGSGYRVDVDVTSYPFPLKQLFRAFAGIWNVEPDGDGCSVTIIFEADIRRPFGPIVRQMAKTSTKDLDATLDSYGLAAVAP